MYGLQRLCFGTLRPVEIEQLYEKAWFAVTETCLAMTIFREEVGAFFLVMFTALVTGKVWGWIGEGRVEVFEQQPPANPRLFHTRLSISLLISIVYDVWLLKYAIDTVVQQARPTMMVMFLFEFALLAVSSCQTGFRYMVLLWERQVIKKQTRQRLEERRRQIRDQRDEIIRRRETEGEAADPNEEIPNEDDVDEMDIEVPGWEAKGQWVLSLDLIAGTTLRLSKACENALLTLSRFRQVGHLHGLLLRSLHVLRITHPYHPRLVPHYEIFREEAGRSDPLPPGAQGHEPVS
jgi:E3 ubiquitin-protein ligase synoviolin